MSKSKDDLPLCGETPRPFYPHFAAELARRYGPRGLYFAIALERAHWHQQRHGRTDRLHDRGQVRELTVFRWSPQQQKEDFPFWDERTIRRLVGNPSVNDSTPNLVAEGLLRKASRRVEGRVSDDWYSVNYEAIGETCVLFPTLPVARSLPPPQSGGPAGAGGGSAARSGDPAGATGGPAAAPFSPEEDHSPQTSSPPSDSFSKNREEEETAHRDAHPDLGGEIPTDDAGRFLAWLGLSPAEICAELARFADMPARCLRTARGLARMKRHGFKFRLPGSAEEVRPRGYAMKLIEANKAEIDDDEARFRAEAQRRRSAEEATQLNVAHARRRTAETVAAIGPEAKFLAESFTPPTPQDEIDRFVRGLSNEQWQAALRAVLADWPAAKRTAILAAERGAAKAQLRRLVWDFVNQRQQDPQPQPSNPTQEGATS